MRRRREMEALAQRQNTRVQGQQLPQPQVWLRRQKVPQQQVLAGPTPIKGVERKNTVMMNPNQQAEFVPR